MEQRLTYYQPFKYFADDHFVEWGSMPEELASYVRDFQVYMTPRQGSPYGCTILSYGDTLTVNISKFTDDTELENLFFGNLHSVISE